MARRLARTAKMSKRAEIARGKKPVEVCEVESAEEESVEQSQPVESFAYLLLIPKQTKYEREV